MTDGGKMPISVILEFAKASKSIGDLWTEGIDVFIVLTTPWRLDRDEVAECPLKKLQRLAGGVEVAVAGRVDAIVILRSRWKKAVMGPFGYERLHPDPAHVRRDVLGETASSSSDFRVSGNAK